MLDDNRQPTVAEAAVETPVQVLGSDQRSGAGDNFPRRGRGPLRRQIAEKRAPVSATRVRSARDRVSAGGLDKVLKAGEVQQLNLIIKWWTPPVRFEALESSLLQLDVGRSGRHPSPATAAVGSRSRSPTMTWRWAFRRHR
ncbi:hypothetical protein GCM10023238_04540 [Streptomyces heliomycini]